MRLDISADLLAAVLVRLASIPQTKGPVAALACFRLRVAGSTLTVTATDLDTWGEVYTHDILDGDDGEVVVNAQLLLSLVRAQSGSRLELSAEPGKLRIKGKANATLPAMAGEGFPLIPQAHDISGSVDPSILIGALREVSYAQASDEARPNLCGVYVTADKAVATDGHRMAMVDATGALPLAGRPGVLIPGPLAGLIERNFAKRTNADVCVTGQHLIVSTIDMTFGGRLVDMSFPDFSSVLPKESPQYACTKADLSDAVKLCGLVKPVGDKVELTFDANRFVELFAESSDNGDVRQPVAVTEIEGNPQRRRVCVNWRYLAETLGHMQQEMVEIATSGELAPMVLSGRAGSTHVIMPMRG